MMTKPFRLKASEPSEQDLLGQIIEYLRWQQTIGRVAWFARVNSGGIKKRNGQFLRFYWLYLPQPPASLTDPRGMLSGGKDFGKPVSKGMADLHGMLDGGRYFALEVKKPGEKPTPEQAYYLELVRASGGISSVVYSYTDVPGLLFPDGLRDE